MAYNELRPLAFRIASSVDTLPHTFVTLRLPSKIKSAARHAIADAINLDPEKVRLPIRVLNRAVRMLIPDLISIVRDADKESNELWLYAFGEEPASSFALQQILRSWIGTALHKRVPPALKQEIRQSISLDALRWQPESVDLARGTTAKHEPSLASVNDGPQKNFVLLPDFVAAKLSAPGIVFEWNVHRLHFRRAPMSPGSSGTELISWPPLPDEQGWPYSVVITVTLQTIPFQAFPQVHCELGIRRWAGPPISRLPGGRKQTSVYLLDTVPWVEGLHYSNSFQIAPFSWRRKASSEQKQGESKYKLSWDTALVHLLNDLHPKSVFPDPELLYANPNDYIRDSGPSAAIVYRNGIEPAHKIGTGLMPRDRFLFAEQLKMHLNPDLEFIDPLLRKPYRVVVPQNPFFVKEQDEEIHKEEDEEEQLAGTHTERRGALAQATQKKFTLEIWYQSTLIRSALLQAVEKLLGKPPHTEQDEYTWTASELELAVHTFPLGNRGDVLKLKPGSLETLYDRLRDAIQQRVETIAPFPSVTGYAGALIELDDASVFDNDDDPKAALRLAFARHGRLTQFITPQPEKKHLTEKQKRKEETMLEQRALSSVRDLLRQVGVQGLLPRIVLHERESSKGFRIPEPLHYLGVWLVKQYRESSPTHIAQTLPVFVHMVSNAPGIQVIAPGFRTWLEYPDALLALAGGQALGVRGPRDAYQFIIDTLTRCVPAFGDTLLFCQAQNMRSAWGWLQNTQMTETLPKDLERYPRLRIIRFRDGVHETPEWYGQSEKEAYGSPSGLFAIGESGHVFASVQEKPPSAKHLSKELSMVNSRIITNRKTKEEKIAEPDPSIMAWNPGIVEMTVACAQTDEALMCAIVANELRHHFASHFAHPTVFPLPLHLASLLREYVLPLQKIAPQEDGEDFYPEDDVLR